MGMNNYRTLNPEERHEAGDEFKGHGGNWINCSDYAGDLVGTSHPCRRPIPEGESPWIPISTPPTEDDGDANGQVLVRHGNESVNTWHWSRARGPHWMRIAPLPLPEPMTNEVLADLIAGIYDKKITAKYRTLADKTLKEIVLDVLNAEIPE
tara:strand:+ start:4769 stop:5224 length:456 start_codon:yes stop_codon:yes gene_type:complete